MLLGIFCRMCIGGLQLCLLSWDQKKMLSSCIFISIMVDGRHREGMNKWMNEWVNEVLTPLPCHPDHWPLPSFALWPLMPPSLLDPAWEPNVQGEEGLTTTQLGLQPYSQREADFLFTDLGRDLLLPFPHTPSVHCGLRSRLSLSRPCRCPHTPHKGTWRAETPHSAAGPQPLPAALSSRLPQSLALGP